MQSRNKDVIVHRKGIRLLQIHWPFRYSLYVGILKLILTPLDDCLLDPFYFKTQTAFYNISKQVSDIEVKTEQHDPEKQY